MIYEEKTKLYETESNNSTKNKLKILEMFYYEWNIFNILKN